MCIDDERPQDPDEFDPFAKESGEFFSLSGENEVIPEPEPEYNEIERLGLRKVCEHCSKKHKVQIFMETIEGTAADIYHSELEDNIDVRTWAVCRRCHRVRLIT